jgi:hypothetical protein
MPIPWLGVIDTLLDLSSLALSKRTRRPAADDALTTSAGGALGHLETRLTGVVVAALKEAFDRDAKRLELEREQLERERARAERLLKLDLLRQAGDREIGRLRMMAGVAVGSWIGTLLFASQLLEGSLSARVMLGAGWVLLLGAMSLSFAAQARVSRVLATIDAPAARADDITAGPAGAVAPWLIVCGLAVIGFAALLK